MKAALDIDGNRIIVGSSVIVPFKGYAEPKLCKVTGVKIVNIQVQTPQGTDHTVRADTCIVFREEKKKKVIPEHDFEIGDWVKIKVKSDVNNSEGRIVDFPNTSMATVLVPESNWKGKTAVMPVCEIFWLEKVNV